MISRSPNSPQKKYSTNKQVALKLEKRVKLKAEQKKEETTKKDEEAPRNETTETKFSVRRNFSASDKKVRWAEAIGEWKDVHGVIKKLSPRENKQPEEVLISKTEPASSNATIEYTEHASSYCAESPMKPRINKVCTKRSRKERRSSSLVSEAAKTQGEPNKTTPRVNNHVPEPVAQQESAKEIKLQLDVTRAREESDAHQVSIQRLQHSLNEEKGANELLRTQFERVLQVQNVAMKHMESFRLMRHILLMVSRDRIRNRLSFWQRKAQSLSSFSRFSAVTIRLESSALESSKIKQDLECAVAHLSGLQRSYAELKDESQDNQDQVGSKSMYCDALEEQCEELKEKLCELEADKALVAEMALKLTEMEEGQAAIEERRERHEEKYVRTQNEKQELQKLCETLEESNAEAEMKCTFAEEYCRVIEGHKSELELECEAHREESCIQKEKSATERAVWEAEKSELKNFHLEECVQLNDRIRVLENEKVDIEEACETLERETVDIKERCMILEETQTEALQKSALMIQERGAAEARCALLEQKCKTSELTCQEIEAQNEKLLKKWMSMEQEKIRGGGFVASPMPQFAASKGSIWNELFGGIEQSPVASQIPFEEDVTEEDEDEDEENGSLRLKEIAARVEIMEARGQQGKRMSQKVEIVYGSGPVTVLQGMCRGVDSRKETKHKLRVMDHSSASVIQGIFCRKRDMRLVHDMNASLESASVIQAGIARKLAILKVFSLQKSRTDAATRSLQAVCRAKASRMNIRTIKAATTIQGLIRGITERKAVLKQIETVHISAVRRIQAMFPAKKLRRRTRWMWWCQHREAADKVMGLLRGHRDRIHVQEAFDWQLHLYEQKQVEGAQRKAACYVQGLIRGIVVRKRVQVKLVQEKTRCDDMNAHDFLSALLKDSSRGGAAACMNHASPALPCGSNLVPESHSFINAGNQEFPSRNQAQTISEITTIRNVEAFQAVTIDREEETPYVFVSSSEQHNKRVKKSRWAAEEPSPCHSPSIEVGGNCVA